MAAERAGGVPLKPLVNTVDVKRVLAVGEEPEDLHVLKHRQADRALEPGPGTPEGGELEERKRLDHGLVDPRELPGPREGIVDVIRESTGRLVAELGVDEEN